MPGVAKTRLVDRVGVEVAPGGVTGHDTCRGRSTGAGRRPNSAATRRAPRSPSTTSTSVEIAAAGSGPSRSSSSPSDGVSQLASRWPWVRKKPAPTEPTASSDQRHRSSPRATRAGGRHVRRTSGLPALLAEERHEHQPGHVERGEPGARSVASRPNSPALPAGRGRTPPR